MTKTTSPVKFRDLTPEQRKEKADLILSRYESEGSIAEMAKELGVSPTSVYKLLVTERPEDWRTIQAARTIHHLEQAKQAIRDAKDHLELGKAKELAARAGWELERLNHRVYGQQKQEDKPQAPIIVNIGIVRKAKDSEETVVIENTATAAEILPAPVETAQEPAPKPKKKLIIYQ